MSGAQKVGNLWMGSRYVVKVGASPNVWSYEQLVWVYKERTTTQYRAYGVVPMGKSVSFSVAFIDHANHKLGVPVKSDAVAQTVVNYVHAKAPYILCGYDEGLNRIRNSNFQAMYNRVQEEKMRLMGSMDFINNDGAEW